MSGNLAIGRTRLSTDFHVARNASAPTVREAHKVLAVKQARCLICDIALGSFAIASIAALLFVVL